MTRNLKFAIALAVVGVVGGGVGVGYAAIPSTAGRQITACYSQANPVLRVIDTDAGQTCAAGETALSWSQGWQFRGEYSGVPNYRKGDVVRISRAYNTGCTTPQGTWLALVDGASPCTERPESWATLALDAPKGPDVHWARLNANGTVAASSEKVYIWNSSWYRGLIFSRVADPSQCSVTVTVADYTQTGISVSGQPWGGSGGGIIYTVKRADGSSVWNVPLSFSLICGTYQ